MMQAGLQAQCARVQRASSIDPDVRTSRSPVYGSVGPVHVDKSYIHVSWIFDMDPRPVWIVRK